jgi:Fic family protein
MNVVSGESRPRGRELEVRWNGARVRAWVPDLLANQVFEVGINAARRTEQAAAAVAGAGARTTRFEPLAMLLLRTEGVASSSIEGLRTPLEEVAAAEIGERANETATSISQNLAAVIDALDTSTRDLETGDLHDWHRRLMGTSGTLPPEMVGAFRQSQSWIGGTSPRDAAFVPPPAERVGVLMDDLVSFVNAEHLDPVTQAAVAHAQFETIHPYGDGNGRIGRMLIGWVLARRLRITLPPPVSVFIARDPGGYLAGMTMFRLGQLDLWVDWVAAALTHSSKASTALMAQSEALLHEWRYRLSDVRADSTVHRVLDLLVEHPVVSADLIARRLDVSERSGRTALGVLANLSIVEEYARVRQGTGRPRRYWKAGELISLVTSWTAD